MSSNHLRKHLPAGPGNTEEHDNFTGVYTCLGQGSQGRRWMYESASTM
jgi:hypothetical protein